MADQANVSSIDALDAFRSKLIAILEKALLSLNEASEEVSRARSWLQGEQRIFWDHEIRRLNRELEDARQQLFSAELSSMRETSSVEERAMKQCRDRLRHSEDKQRRTRKWLQVFESEVATEARKLESLRSFLTVEMPKATAFLRQAIEALDAYSNVTRGGLRSDPPPTEPEPPENQ